MMDQLHEWRKSLPFLAGLNALIERIARGHHQSLRDPNTELFRPHVAHENSWKELLDASYAALASVGAEIKNAKTEAEVASAQLRNQTYLDGFKDIQNALMRLAVQNLSSFDSTIELLCLENLAEAKTVCLAACGTRGLSGNFEFIPAQHWQAGVIEWERWRLTVDDKTTWIGIRILDLADLNDDQLDRILGDMQKFPPSKNPGGRPPEHDWEGAKRCAREYITKYGRPTRENRGSQTRLLEAVEDWFERIDGPKSPDRKSIRDALKKANLID